MSENENKVSLKVIKDFFGVREGCTIKDFAEEIKAMSEEDKIQIHGGLVDGSLSY